MHKPTVHLICNAHLDPVWQWQWEEGCAETLSTFRNAIQLLKEDDELIFNHNEALLYRWILEFDPSLFEEIQKLVIAGRWNIGGGWYLQPDVNLAGTESILRCISEGRHFFEKHFNVHPRVAYNFDSFGHGAGLPQLLKLTGYKMYIFMRPEPENLQLPSDFCRWQGTDGSEILILRIEIGLYHTEEDNIEQRLQEGVELALQLNRDVPVFWGIGNHGGGATREDLTRITRFRNNETRVHIKHSSTEQLYQALKVYANETPLIKGDLQNIFPGCYTSMFRLKRRANRSLQLLLQTEQLRTITWWILDQTYPHTLLSELWRDHLFNDFHDILPGTCIEPAEQDALDLYGKIEQTARKLRLDAAVSINQGENKPAYLPLTIMNNLDFNEAIPVETEFMISHRPKWTGQWHVQLKDSYGEPVTLQEEQPEALLPFHEWRRKICFMARLPQGGVKRYFAEANEGPVLQKTAAPAVNVSINQQGFVEGLTDVNGNQYLNSPLFQPLVVQDDCDAWGTGCLSYRDVIGAFELETGSHQILHSGPVRTIYETLLHYNKSRLRLHTLLYNDWPVLEFRLLLNWHEQNKRLKLPVDIALSASKIAAEVPGGITTYDADGQEHVHRQWLMVSDATRAIGIVHNGLHGFDYLDGELRLSALRSAAYCHERGLHLDPLPARKYMDQGVHEFRILLTIGKPQELHSKLPNLAQWLNAPAPVFSYLPVGSNTNSGVTPMPEDQSFIQSKPQNIHLRTLKPSNNKQALIIQFQENAGIHQDARIRLRYPDISMPIKFRPFEIKNLRVQKDGTWAEVDLIHEQKELHT
ncbi:MAG: hypothetical protein GF313_05575 [Caldithrix sp.]|nr:hypothetical protein [Caldithrix sp.]